MLTINGNGRLTRDPELRSTRSGKSVATISVASDRRDRRADPIYVDLVLWEGHAEAAAQHLVKGQSVAFSASRPARAPPPPTTSRSEQPCRGPGGVRVDPGPRASSRSTMRYAMNAHQHPPQSTSDPANWLLRRDAAWEEQKARLWAMTREERVRAMRAGKFSLRLCLHSAGAPPRCRSSTANLSSSPSTRPTPPTPPARRHSASGAPSR
ncbi:MAG TPA: single-stranded DNA-binding protein [Baekduia sp.]|nr:single-stranded DNA-binding protein [Baekduia sp.]